MNDETTKPLKSKLVELEDGIKKQRGEIAALQANILRNDFRIKELLTQQA